MPSFKKNSARQKFTKAQKRCQWRDDICYDIEKYKEDSKELKLEQEIQEIIKKVDEPMLCPVKACGAQVLYYGPIYM